MHKALLAAAWVAIAAPAWACDTHAPGKEPKRTAAAKASSATGVVREVDAEQGTITLGHGRIANLRMPPMESMVFKVAPAALTDLKPGDKVSFQASLVDRQPTVTRIRLVRD
jgi:Cu(I)/Ag(I) efflux system periplasmic protein CusF